jgi:hypothetical protein
VLTRALALCHGDMKAALGAYNSGRCGGGKKYAKRVLQEREALLHAAGVEETQPQQQAAASRRRAAVAKAKRS